MDINIIKRITKNRVKYFNDVHHLSASQILNKYKEFYNNNKTYNDISYLLALIKEVFFRIKKITIYDEQFWCALAMYYGFITEFNTGEGKTYSAAITALLLSLNKEQIHIVTTNDYLAQRDAENLSEIFNYFGLSIDFNNRIKNKKELYSKNIIYSSSSELVFDYLKMILAGERENFNFSNVIIDEIDYVLLDNANSEFSVSTNIGEEIKPDAYIYKKCKHLFCSFIGKEESVSQNKQNEDDCDYIFNKTQRQYYLTDLGYEKLCNYFGATDIINENLYIFNAFLGTIEAFLFCKKGLNYTVKNKKIFLLSESNGRIMENSRLENEVHSAIESKENVPFTNHNGLSYSMSYQVFFSNYNNVTGMSGTAFTAREEFNKIFGIRTLKIAPHLKPKRIDYPDYLLKTNKEKIDFIIDHLVHYRKISIQPILIIAETEKIAKKIFNKANSLKNVALFLNSNKDDEQSIINNAGLKNAITISTNLLSRGTDIILEEILKNTNGLYVICTSHYMSMRIDRQIKGRAGRQGNKGETIYITSLEDEFYEWISTKNKKKIVKIQNELSLSRDTLWYLKNFRLRKRLSKIIKKEQQNIQTIFQNSRFYNFLLDMSINKCIEKIFYEQDSTRNKPIDNLIKAAAKYNHEISEKLNINKNDIDDLINEKCELLGPNTTPALINNLFFEISYKLLIIYKDSMRKLKGYMHFYLSDNIQNKIYRFQSICGKEFDTLMKDIWVETICYFLNAEKRQFDITG